mgnify:CR=1 FL=1
MAADLINPMRAFFRTGKTVSKRFRRSCLKKLRAVIEANEDQILKALKQDLEKCPVEAYASELSFVYAEIDHALRYLGGWMRPQKKKTPLFLWPGKSRLYPEPKGVVLIIGPWNYPFLLVFAPLIGALAAGNCAVIKPSEMAPHTAQVIEDIITAAADSPHIRVIQGDRSIAEELCELPWDHLFFTGSTRVGHSVMKAASKNLTPLTLELGGKNPCFVLADADLQVAAERIVWGKYLNAGQTCLAPDIVYVDKHVSAELSENILKAIERLYGADPEASPDYGRVQSSRHIERLAAYVQDVRILCGGQYNKETRYFAPTVVRDVPADSRILSEEIFGPILAIIEFDQLEEQIEQLRGQPKPLAVYVFSKSRALQQLVLHRLPSGTACVNDTLKQALSSYLPFGGIGESGVGQYHGRASFDCFTHYRSIFKTGFRGFRWHYPPYRFDVKFIKKFMRWFMR